MISDCSSQIDTFKSSRDLLKLKNDSHDDFSIPCKLVVNIGDDCQCKQNRKWATTLDLQHKANVEQRQRLHICIIYSFSWHGMLFNMFLNRISIYYFQICYRFERWVEFLSKRGQVWFESQLSLFIAKRLSCSVFDHPSTMMKEAIKTSNSIIIREFWRRSLANKTISTHNDANCEIARWFTSAYDDLFAPVVINRRLEKSNEQHQRAV